MSFMGNMIGNKALAAHGKNEYEKALQLYNEAYEKGMAAARIQRFADSYGASRQGAGGFEKN